MIHVTHDLAALVNNTSWSTISHVTSCRGTTSHVTLSHVTMSHVTMSHVTQSHVTMSHATDPHDIAAPDQQTAHQINKQPQPRRRQVCTPCTCMCWKEGRGGGGGGRERGPDTSTRWVTPFGCNKGGMFSKRLQTRSSECNSAQSKKYALAPPRPPHTKRIKTTDTHLIQNWKSKAV